MPKVHFYHDNIHLAIDEFNGEILAIREACKKLNQNRLWDLDMYVTLEPCTMCAAAISFARIKNIYFAALDEKGGGVTSNAKIYDNDPHLWKPTVHQLPEFADESAQLLRDFFKIRRRNGFHCICLQIPSARSGNNVWIRFVDVVIKKGDCFMKIAAYARVSTEKESQVESFEKQIEFFNEFINLPNISIF